MRTLFPYVSRTIQVASHRTLLLTVFQCLCGTCDADNLKYLITCGFWFLGFTLSKYTYALFDSGECLGKYTIKTFTIGACSSGGKKYQIVPGTASLVLLLVPTALSSTHTLDLSGYSVRTQYSDDKCTIISSAASYSLNSCNNYAGGLGGYVKYTATAYTIAQPVDIIAWTRYSDSLCFTAVSTYRPTTRTRVENLFQTTMTFVNSNGVPPSFLSLASIRLVHIIIYSHVTTTSHSSQFQNLLTLSYPIKPNLIRSDPIRSDPIRSDQIRWCRVLSRWY